MSYCECGCGQTPRGKLSRFVIGHSRKGKAKKNLVIHFSDGVSVICLERMDGDILPCYINTKRYAEVERYRWYAKKYQTNFYAVSDIPKEGRKNHVPMHQLLTNFAFAEVDHRDRNGLNNQDNNLRDSEGKNKQNMGLRGSNTSGLIGVSWSKTKRKWRAYISVSYRILHLGYFPDKISAGKARDSAALKYRKEFAVLNFPQEAR